MLHVTTTEEWARWEKQVINGVFPLRRAISHSDHSAVFLTEHSGLGVPNALLKLVPAIPTLRDTQLAYWETATTLAHPNLIRVLDSGRCQLGGLQLLFVVMEYAEQTLARFLSEQTLAPSALETALQPILTSLGFLHRKQLVHGALKPSNVLLVDRQLKLASDTVRPAGESTASIAGASAYDPPEARDGSFTSAGDIWSLGVIMVEALTRHLPSWPDKRAHTPDLPSTLPDKFVDIVRQCLSRDPAKRPTVEDLETQFNRAGRIRIPTIAAVPGQVWLAPDEEPELMGPTQWAGHDEADSVPVIGAQSPPKIGAQLLALLAEESAHYPVLLPLQSESPESIAATLIARPQTFQAAPSRQPGRYRRALAIGLMTVAGLVVGLTGMWPGLRLSALQGDSGPAAAATSTVPEASAAAAASAVSEAPVTAEASVASDSSALAGLTTVSTRTRPSSPVGAGPASAESAASPTPTAADLSPEDEDFADSQTPVAPPPAVLHEVAPDVPMQALRTIRGHIKFALRLRIDRSGGVVHVSLASRSPSRYFTRIAVQTARRWQFVGADDPKPRHCLVWFDFTRRGAVAYSDLMKMRYVQLD